jgi:1-acyl-sn-glycerol-3-phosphate acyltransferase
MPEGRVGSHLPPESSNGHARAEPSNPESRAAANTGTPGPSNRGFSIGVPEFVYKFVRALARALCVGFFRIKIEGAEKIPATGAAILAPVHRSFVDFLIVGTTITKRKVFFMAKDDLWKSKPLGAFLDSFGAFPVNRDGADRLALDRSQDVLEKDELLILFPEGTRRSGPVIVDLHEGAAFLSARTGAPIYPIGVGGTSDAMPKGSKLPRPVKVKLIVGDPIYPPERSSGGRVARSKVHALTAELQSELQRLYDIAEKS